MSNPNREWKQFRKRWNASRFEKFLFGSIVLHVLIALAIGVGRGNRETPKDEAKLAKQESQAKEKEKAKEKAETEIREILKEELAEEQLREFYDELTEDYLDEAIADLLWEDLLEELDLDLEELADLFEDEEAFDAVMVEESLQDLKAAMLAKITDLIEHRGLQIL